MSEEIIGKQNEENTEESFTAIACKMCDETINHFGEEIDENVKSKINSIKNEFDRINKEIFNTINKLTSKKSDKHKEILYEFTNMIIVEPQIYCVMSMMRTDINSSSEIIKVLENMSKYLKNNIVNEFYKPIIDKVEKLILIYEEKKCDQCDEYIELNKDITSDLKSYSKFLREIFVKNVLGKFDDIDESLDESMKEKIEATRKSLIVFNLADIKDDTIIDIAQIYNADEDNGTTKNIDEILGRIQDILPTEEELAFYKKNPSVGRMKFKAKLKNIVGGAVQEDFVDQMWLMVMQLSEINDISQLKDIVGLGDSESEDISDAELTNMLTNLLEEMDSVEEDTDKVE